MKRKQSRTGFTLIELLIVVVVIGVLAAIAIPKFANTKGKALTASIKSDLRNLATAQEAYFYENTIYTMDMSILRVDQSSGVLLEMVEASGAGWSARAIHPAANPIRCAVFFGNAQPVPPAVGEGVINCSDGAP